jgi:hypothetical protein
MRPWILFIALCIGCGELTTTVTATSGGGDILPPVASVEPTLEATSQFSLALGGVATGRDLLQIRDATGSLRSFATDTLAITSDRTSVAGLLPIGDAADFASGSGARIVPQVVGTAIISYTINGTLQDDTYAVVIPPQTLIQILVGEARGLLASEATVSATNLVALTSRSPTAEALGAVIRNRITRISDSSDPSLFAADTTLFYNNPPASAYEAVIEASNGIIYQFSPVDPSDTSHTVYTHAEARSFLESSDRVAYDQALITAAGIYDGSIADLTGGAFAFRSPSVIEASCLASAIVTSAIIIPAACGPGDANFPSLAPVQILIHPDVGTQSDGRPAFVFYRTRKAGETAVTNVP